MKGSDLAQCKCSRFHGIDNIYGTINSFSRFTFLFQTERASIRRSTQNEFNLLEKRKRHPKWNARVNIQKRMNESNEWCKARCRFIDAIIFHSPRTNYYLKTFLAIRLFTMHITFTHTRRFSLPPRSSLCRARFDRSLAKFKEINLIFRNRIQLCFHFRVAKRVRSKSY